MMPEPRVAGDVVGRDRQVRVIDDAITAGAAKGRGQVLLVPGEPGIGKTRLARAAIDAPAPLACGPRGRAPWQGDGVPPLWPWAELMRQVTGGEIEFSARDLPSSPEGAAARGFHQFESVARAARDASTRAHRLLVLDDLHWADVASIRLLDFLAAALPRHCLRPDCHVPANGDRAI